MKKSKLLEPVISPADSPMGITVNAMNFFRKVREQFDESNFDRIKRKYADQELQIAKRCR